MAGESDNGIQTETATLLENGEIEVLVVTGDDGVIGHGGFFIKPEEPEYSEYKARFNLVKPGDWRSIERQYKDGNWIDLPPRRRAVLPQDPTDGKLI